MGHSKATAAIARHLWQQHGRTRSTGTVTERQLFHEELHAIADEGELNHFHGEDGSYVTKCAGCDQEHVCTELSIGVGGD